jgi:CheY-like chemotaxis protein/DNA-binding protein YbaB
MSIGYEVTKLVDARAEALQASQVKDYFLSNMSHEIRTPLNAILGFVSLLIDEDISKKHHNYLSIIQNSGENLLSIINDILDFSKLRSGEFTIEPKIFSLHEELNYTMELFVASASSKSLTITSFISPDIPKELFADPLRIKQVISNFLSNAIKFSPENGIISVEASCHDNILKISVKDEGIGIAQEDQENIFLAFMQAANSDIKKQEGTGLGLSICNQLVTHMEGKIYVESILGQGSTFHIEIPVEVQDAQCRAFDDMVAFKDLKIVLYKKEKKTPFQYEAFLQYANIFAMDVGVIDNLEEPFDVALFVHENIDFESKELIKKTTNKKFIAMMSRLYDDYEYYPHIQPMCFPLYCSKMRSVFSSFLEPAKKHSFTHQERQKFQGHILVAEDNEANQELIKILLKKYGLTYEVARHGLEAFELYKQNKFDLILMDEQMPVMDGNEAVAKILEYEKEHNLPHTPVSAITANVIKGAKERGLSSGFDEFLGKPIIIKELERVFDKFLQPSFMACEEISLQEDEAFEIEGIDVEKLCRELMLDYEELQLLFGVYRRKMDSSFVELKEAIAKSDYKQIALLAHSIKGSSGNFRLEKLQKIATTMEEAAKEKQELFDYTKTLENMWRIIEKIVIE